MKKFIKLFKFYFVISLEIGTKGDRIWYIDDYKHNFRYYTPVMISYVRTIKSTDITAIIFTFFMFKLTVIWTKV